MAATGKLGEYPALARWFEQASRSSTGSTPPGESLARRTCEALAAPAPERARRWVAGFDAFLRSSAAPLQDFLATEELFSGCDAPLMDVISDIGETALRHGHGDLFLHTMQSGAEATGLVVLRFLSAWTALNSGRLELCVDECEKVTEPFASVYTIQGQALLELGRVDDAVEALAVAVKLSPGELLAWFQLAKAHHVAGRAEAAWSALRECERLAGQTDEIALFMAMIALDEPTCSERLAAAWRALRPRLCAHASDATVAMTLLKIALRRGVKEDAASLCADARWADMRGDQTFVRELASVLRRFQELGWLDVASAFLRHVVPPADGLA